MILASPRLKSAIPFGVLSIVRACAAATCMIPIVPAPPLTATAVESANAYSIFNVFFFIYPPLSRFHLIIVITPRIIVPIINSIVVFEPVFGSFIPMLFTIVMFVTRSAFVPVTVNMPSESVVNAFPFT